MIAAARARVTDRAGRWVTAQVGRDGRSVSEVARELGCDWHTVMDAVLAYGTPLVDDPDRIGQVNALGLDETLFARTGVWRTQSWCTSIVDVGGPSQLLDVVEGRTAKAASAWIDARPEAWRNSVAWAMLDLSGPYRKAFNDSLPDATQVADPFHVVKLANTKLDECRRRVQNDTLGHRGRKDDPLYKSRRLLTKGHERLDERGNEKLLGFLEAGDPHGEVRMCWHANYLAVGGGSRRSVDGPVVVDALKVVSEAGDHSVVAGGLAGPARFSASARRACTSASWASIAGRNSGVVTKFGQVSQMLA